MARLELQDAKVKSVRTKDSETEILVTVKNANISGDEDGVFEAITKVTSDTFKGVVVIEGDDPQTVIDFEGEKAAGE